MKIAINTRFLIKDKLEGIGRVSFELSERLVREHPYDEFLFIFDRPYDPSFVFSDNVKPVVVFPPARHPFLWKIWFDYAIPKVIQNWGADVFFSPDGYLSLRSKIPTLMLVHDLAYEHFPDQIPFWVKKYYQHYGPFFCKRADHIACVSDFTRRDVIEQYQVKENKTSVLYNGCQSIYQPITEDQKNTIKEKYSEGRDYFFYVGAMHPRKNVDQLIDAFNRFKQNTNNDVQLLLGGRWAWQTGKIKQAYDRSAFQKDIHFLGYLPEVELPGITAAASIFTYISKFEGFGLPILEAMNCDVPSITSNRSSLPEVGGDACLYVDPDQPRQISEAMERLYSNPSLRLSLIEKGIQQRQKFNWDRSAKQLYQLLVQLAD